MRAWPTAVRSALGVLLLAACATPRVVTAPPTPAPAPRPPARPAPSGPDVAVGWEQTGRASWYGTQHHGKRTASGEVYDMHALTAAHRRLPLGARVLVTNVDNGRSVEVRINDRGPFVDGRILDLSHAAAERLGALAAGVINVTIRVVALPTS